MQNSYKYYETSPSYIFDSKIVDHVVCIVDRAIMGEGGSLFRSSWHHSPLLNFVVEADIPSVRRPYENIAFVCLYIICIASPVQNCVASQVDLCMLLWKETAYFCCQFRYGEQDDHIENYDIINFTCLHDIFQSTPTCFAY